MIPIPELNAWTDTKDALHHATQQIGLFRKAVTPSLPNALHLPLFVREFGLSTGVLPFGTLGCTSHRRRYATSPASTRRRLGWPECRRLPCAPI